MQRALDEAKVTLADIDAIAVTAGPGSGGRAARRGRRGQGVRAGRRQADLRRQPPRRARRRRHARARPAARAGDRAAGLRRALVAAAGRRHHGRRHAARRDHRRRGRRGVRQGGPAARHGVPGRAGHRPCGPRRRRRVDRVPARAHRAEGPGRAPVRLLLLRAEDRGRALGRGPRARRRAGAGGRRRGELPGRGLRRAHRQGDRRLPGERRARRWSSAAGSRPTRGCGCWPRNERRSAGIRVRVPRPRLCTDNGAMVAALGLAPGRRRRRARAGWTCRPTPPCH